MRHRPRAAGDERDRGQRPAPVPEHRARRHRAAVYCLGAAGAGVSALGASAGAAESGLGAGAAACFFVRLDMFMSFVTSFRSGATPKYTPVTKIVKATAPTKLISHACEFDIEPRRSYVANEASLSGVQDV